MTSLHLLVLVELFLIFTHMVDGASLTTESPEIHNQKTAPETQTGYDKVTSESVGTHTSSVITPASALST
ncbi:hypothetical protein BaRGS_00033057, partial [Batillaria attramentaria]